MFDKKQSAVAGLPVFSYFAVHDENYPRNRRVREFLAQYDVQLDLVAIEAGRGYLRNAFDLTVRAFRPAPRLKMVVLAEFSLQYFFQAWVYARLHRSYLVVDRFIGLYETRVEDYAEVSTSRFRRFLYRVVDDLAVRSADLVLSDTDVRAGQLMTESRLRRPPVVLPVGAPAWARPRTEITLSQSRSPSTLRVLYYGNFIPLHGVPILLEAVQLARRKRGIELTLVGAGAGLQRAQALCAELGLLDVCVFLEPVPEAKLVDLIHDHDVVVGVFGRSNKAKSVIANKVWQGLSCGKVVVTRSTQALDALVPLVGRQLVQVPFPEVGLAEILSALEVDGWGAAGAEPPNIVLERYVEDRFDELRLVIDQLVPGHKH